MTCFIILSIYAAADVEAAAAPGDMLESQIKMREKLGVCKSVLIESEICHKIMNRCQFVGGKHTLHNGSVKRNKKLSDEGEKRAHFSRETL